MTLSEQEKRLMIKALIIARGSITKAYAINVPCGYFMTYRTYQNKVKNVYRINREDLKKETKCGNQKQLESKT